VKCERSYDDYEWKDVRGDVCDVFKAESIPTWLRIIGLRRLLTWKGLKKAISLLLQELYKPQNANAFQKVLRNLKINVVLCNFTQSLR
jgi:hypothetical protein